NNSAGTSYYLSGAQGVGWSDVRFSQTTNSNVFVTQGNDIVGEVIITDNSGIDHEIPGFIKWRTPSGNNPHTMVFQPSPGTYILATNGFNGAASYTIDQNNYIGLTKPGSTLTISPVPGTVSGNASTSGLLDALNDILGDLPQLNVTGTVVDESDGVATVTIDLNTSSTQTIRTELRTYSETAVDEIDYDSLTTLVSFLPGETQKTVQVPITVDAIDEYDEYFLVRIYESLNAAITGSQDTVWVIENVLPVEYLHGSVTCEPNSSKLRWSTASEHNSSHFEIYKSNDVVNWNLISTCPAQGNSTQITNYQFDAARECMNCQTYYRIKQIDWNGEFEEFPIITANCNTPETLLYPNPAHESVSVSIHLNREETIVISIIDINGKIMKSQQLSGFEGQNTFHVDLLQIGTGMYTVHVSTSTNLIRKSLHILK
ncbi:T9SS type A sorting domain-containing protein, partial [Crocinitomicaceae bacterium]|nr:T9SS type A sorting domain-containing protein [Crocinitomicaceae bacterium]